MTTDNNNNQSTSSLSSSTLTTTTTNQEQNSIPERRNSVQRRASLRLFKGVDDDDSTINNSSHNNFSTDEERSNRATKELVERVQKQNEEYKKSNTQLKSQLDGLLNELIQANLQRAELLTDIDRERLEKKLLKEKLQWYDWSDGIWELTKYVSISFYGANEKESIEFPIEPDPEELKDTE